MSAVDYELQAGAVNSASESERLRLQLQTSLSRFEKSIQRETWSFVRYDEMLQDHSADNYQAVALIEGEEQTAIADALAVDGVAAVFFQDIEREGTERTLAEYRFRLFEGKLSLKREALISLQKKIIELESRAVEVFYNSKLGEIAKEVNDQQNNLLSLAEVTAILELDKKLKTDPEYQRAFALLLNPESVAQGSIFRLQRQRLNELFAIRDDATPNDTSPCIARNSKIRDEALAHELAVTEAVLDFIGSPVLALVASVHDFFKHKFVIKSQLEFNAYTDLAPHETASAALGSWVGGYCAEYFRQIFPDTPEALHSALTKLFLKVISAHGAGEYPRKQSVKSPLITKDLLKACGVDPDADEVIAVPRENIRETSRLNRLFGNFYPVCQTPDTIALCESSVPSEDEIEIRNMAIALNLFDRLVGGSLGSLLKYNLDTPFGAFEECTSLVKYLEKFIFASLADCLDETNFEALQAYTKSEILTSVRHMQNQAALLLLICKNGEKFKADSSARRLAELREKMNSEMLQLLGFKQLSLDEIGGLNAVDLVEEYNAVKTAYLKTKNNPPDKDRAIKELGEKRNQFNNTFATFLYFISRSAPNELTENEELAGRLATTWKSISDPSFGAVA